MAKKPAPRKKPKPVPKARPRRPPPKPKARPKAKPTATLKRKPTRKGTKMNGKHDPVPPTPVVKPSPTAHEHLAPPAKAIPAAAEPKASRADDLLRRVISTMGVPERLLEHQAAVSDAQVYLRSLAGT